ncbi:hypothetical protein M426DRAFT_18617 [Hypoxylon sp. CI-4A]|nr:hypothetical protein M426DRAFT_18617 [Hypoxylon sp. CI-4A]
MSFHLGPVDIPELAKALCRCRTDEIIVPENYLAQILDGYTAMPQEDTARSRFVIWSVESIWDFFQDKALIRGPSTVQLLKWQYGLEEIPPMCYNVAGMYPEGFQTPGKAGIAPCYTITLPSQYRGFKALALGGEKEELEKIARDIEKIFFMTLEREFALFVTRGFFKADDIKFLRMLVLRVCLRDED